MEGRLLVRQHGDRVEAETITTLAAAADFLGVEATSDQAEHDTVALGDLDRPLTVDEELVAFTSQWFGMATAALEELRCTPELPIPAGCSCGLATSTWQWRSAMPRLSR